VHHSEAGEAAKEAIRETTKQAEEEAGEAAEEAIREEGEVAEEGLPLFKAGGVVFAKHGMVTTMQGSMPVIEKAFPLRALNK
jgi:hypothetical protein